MTRRSDPSLWPPPRRVSNLMVNGPSTLAVAHYARWHECGPCRRHERMAASVELRDAQRRLRTFGSSVRTCFSVAGCRCARRTRGSPGTSWCTVFRRGISSSHTICPGAYGQASPAPCRRAVTIYAEHGLCIWYSEYRNQWTTLITICCRTEEGDAVRLLTFQCEMQHLMQ